MPDFSEGKIYAIVPISGGARGDIYYGSTTMDLEDRYRHHVNEYKRYKRGKVALVTAFKLFKKYGVKNTKIRLLQRIHASRKNEIMEREGEIIRNHACVNKIQNPG